MDRLQIAQRLQECLFAHPQAGPIPVPASLVDTAMAALRFPEKHEPEPASIATYDPHHSAECAIWTTGQFGCTCGLEKKP